MKRRVSVYEDKSMSSRRRIFGMCERCERVYWEEAQKAPEKFEKLRMALPYRQRNKLDAMVLAANSSAKSRLREDAHLLQKKAGK